MSEKAVNYFFVINPNAGRRREQKKLRESIFKACEEAGVTFTVYETVKAGDGGDFMLRTAERLLGECGSAGSLPELRFYFCGGDGTVLESANSFMKLPEELRGGKVLVGILPVGTGNDFLRNFGAARDFLDISRQIKGQAVRTDLLEYRTVTEGADGVASDVKYCANMFNIGFDCQTVVKVNSLRGKPFMTKNSAYTIGVAITLIRMPHTKLKVTFDDGEVREGRFLLALAGNGAYCGGGYFAASEAKTDDGLIDVIMVNPLGRLKFISIVGKYKKGKLLGTKLADEILYFRKCRSVRFESASETDICVDGEIERFLSVDISAVPEKFYFIVPEQNG